MRQIAHYIGLPFAYGGRGPAAYDCYGLVMELYRDRKGYDIPDVRSPGQFEGCAATAAAEVPRWTPVGKDQLECLIFFNILGQPAHVGYRLEPNRFIHCWEKSGGVTIERFKDWEHRIVGLYDYRPDGLLLPNMVS